MAAAATLSERVAIIDERLKALCAARRTLDDPEVDAARQQLRETCSLLLLTDYAFAQVRTRRAGGVACVQT